MSDHIYQQGRNGKFQCPCCRTYTLDSIASYDICPVCFWEDDGTAGDDGLSPNGITLGEARQNFKLFSACDEESKAYVRKPTSEEWL